MLTVQAGGKKSGFESWEESVKLARQHEEV
jgi:hypothetical protein